MDICGVMQSNRISSDEQPTQEVSNEEQATLPVAVEHQSEQAMEITRQNPEQEPTQEINEEQQETLSMAIKQQDFEKLPTPSIEVAQQSPEQEPPQPGSKQPHRYTYTGLIWWLPLLIFAIVFMSLLSERSAIEAWISHNVTHSESSTPKISVIHPLPTPAHSSLIDNTAKLFMDAMMHKEWTVMWPMLSTDSQQLWQGEKDFIHFEQAKYGSLVFTSFNDSSAQEYYIWRDPDTTQIYSVVAILRVSLEASAPRGLLSAPSNLALSKGLFDNTLFALVPYQDKWRVLIAGPADPDTPILVPASPPVTKLLVPIFMYHHVSNVPVNNYLNYGLTVTTTNFDAQLTWLQQQGYHSITQTELFDSLYYGKALPTHPMILTFDDGYEDVYTDALPTLLTHHYRGVFYVITGMIGGNYMTWNQVRALAQDGMQIASHTIHHVNIGQPPAGTSTQNELLLSKETLETQLRQPIQFFCYPTGEPFHNDPVYEQKIVLADLFIDGYVGATLDPFSYDSAIQNAQAPYQLPRIRISGGESLQLFTSILNSTLNVDAYRIANGFAY
jgi:peptidoglycan/xylan/chitin deacetylase (PgdA/CDA1 family)